MDTGIALVLLLSCASVSTVTANTSLPTAATTSSGTSMTSSTSAPNPIKAITLLDPPFVMHTGRKFTGYAVEILDEITLLENSTFKLEIDDDSITYGWEESLPQITKMIGKVRTRADLAIAAFTLTSSLAGEVDISHPILHTGFRILYKIPDAWHPSEAMVTLLRPFSPGLWVLIIFMTALASLMLYVIGRFSPYEDTAFIGKTSTYEGLTLQNSFLYTYSTLMWQGYTAAPKSCSGRILVFIFWLFSVMTLASYIAGLCVLLFRVNPEIRTLPFVSLEEFSRQTKVELMVVANSSTLHYLNVSSRQLEKRLLMKLKDENIFKGHVIGAINKMMESDGKLALLIESAIAEYHSTLEPCNKMVVGEKIGEQSIGFICRNDTHICDILNTQILKMKENGKMDILKSKYFEGGCLQNKGSSYIFQGLPFFDTFGGEPDAIMPLTITITRFSTAFIILTIGILLAGVCLAIEMYWSKKRGSPIPQRISKTGQDDDTEKIHSVYHDESDRS